MAPADALSRWDHVDTTQDNQVTAICPEPIVIQTLDLVLAQGIQSSTWSDPLVLQALEALQHASPLFPYSSKDNWHMTNGHLYFKWMYIPPHKWQPLYAPYMTLPLLGMLDASGPRPYWNGTSGSQASPHLSTLSSLGVLYANRTKLITIPLAPHLLPSHCPHPYPSSNSQLTWLQIYHPWADDGHGWPWPHDGGNSHSLFKKHRCGQSG